MELNIISLKSTNLSFAYKSSHLTKHALGSEEKSDNAFERRNAPCNAYGGVQSPNHSTVGLEHDVNSLYELKACKCPLIKQFNIWHI